MTNRYTSTETLKRFLRLLGILTTLIIGWLFFQSNVQLGFAASSVHQTYVTVQSGDTLYSLFKKQHISPKTLAAILRVPTAAQSLKHLNLHQRIRFSVDAKNNLESLAVSLKSSKTLLIYRAGSHFVARTEKGSFSSPQKISPPVQKKASQSKPKLKPTLKSKSTPSKTSLKVNAKSTQSKSKAKTAIQKTKVPPTFPPLHYAGMIIRHSFYGDAKKYGIPDSVINQIIHIFALQVNFKNTHAGDKLLVAYDDDKDVIAAQFYQGKRIYSAIQYVNAQGGIEYFSPEGESMKKAFNRFPVKYTHINSLFNMHRLHPVTHVIRPHTGVDLAAPLGTPVYSIGDGQVTFIGWEGAYGNIVKIQHNDKYLSIYAHLLRFAPNLSKNTSVKRGQLIGYLGQTGNATGPHVHFEVRTYNVPVNPLTVPLPQASSVPSSQIKAFKARAQNLIAALNYYQKTKLK